MGCVPEGEFAEGAGGGLGIFKLVVEGRFATVPVVDGAVTVGPVAPEPGPLRVPATPFLASMTFLTASGRALAASLKF